MININFNLRQPKSKNKTPINAVIRFNNQKLVYPTGLKILPKYWTNEDQRAKQTTKFPEYPEFNTRLNTIKSDIDKVYTNYLNMNSNKIPSVSELKELIKFKLNPEQEKEKTDDFLKYFQTYLSTLGSKVNDKTNNYISPNTIQSRTRTLEILKEFKKTIPFEKINLDFYKDFVEFLKNKKKFSLNTVGKHIRITKTVLFEAQEDYKTIFVSKRFKTFSEQTPAIYLNENELELLEKQDFSDNDKLNNVRDLFLIGCWTGLRFSDLSNIQTENIKDDTIHIKTQKTAHNVVIPILPPVRRILDKYVIDDKQYLPRAITNQKMNEYLKNIGQDIDKLKKPELTQKNKDGKKVSVKVPKYKLITTHTARRSFATNQYLAGTPVISIMAVTGHKTEKEFLKYIRITTNEHAKILQDNYSKRNKLKVV